jgi:chaperone required for assembly of F1-ATPase
MKRFWKDVDVVDDGDGFGITLDGRRVNTPAKADLAVPTLALADAIAAEWREVGETIDPRAMPLTGLANAAIDRVAADPEAFAATLASYGETDLLCYRADAPTALAERQEARWGQLLAWARRRFDVDFEVTAGITHVAQPQATIQRLAHAVASLDAFRLAGLSQLVTLGGSLITALAVLEAIVPAETAWDAVTLDERWQAEHWGADAEAEAALEIRRRDFLAAARFLELLA